MPQPPKVTKDVIAWLGFCMPSVLTLKGLVMVLADVSSLSYWRSCRWRNLPLAMGLSVCMPVWSAFVAIARVPIAVTGTAAIVNSTLPVIPTPAPLL